MKNFLKSIVAMGILVAIPVSALAVGQEAHTVDRAFQDVTDDTYYEPAINWMAEQGVIEGYETPGDLRLFRPDQCVRRAEMLKMLFLMNGVDVPEVQSGLPFSDTVEGEWYYPYVAKGFERGTVKGYDDNTFKPGNCVNRVEAVKMAVLEFNDGQIPPQRDRTTLREDVTDETQWYYDFTAYVLAARLVGTTHLVVDDKYFPAKEMTRKEVAEMLYRMKAIKDNGKNEYGTTVYPKAL